MNLVDLTKDAPSETETFHFKPQSPNWPGFTVIIPAGQQGFEYGGLRCDIQTAQDGNRTLVKAIPGSTFFLRRLKFSGKAIIVAGEGHLFLASSGSWSGGSNLAGAIALKPGALLKIGAKGNWSYLRATESGIEELRDDPRLFDGTKEWTPLQ